MKNGSLLSSLAIIIALNISAQEQYNIYFGDLHSHTNMSDGLGWLDNVYPMAKDGGADFHALTDHLVPSVMNVNTINRIEWNETNKSADLSTDASFVGIAGYEYTTPAVVGHINLFNMEYNSTNATILTDFYAHIGRFPDAIGQFNHPTFATDNFNNFAYRTDAADEVMCLIEICGGSNESSYQLALSKGWHVAPVDNSDTHNPDWIQGYSNRAVILAKSLTRADLYDAMKHRRVYASQDKNLKVSFSINGEVMGSRLLQPATLNVEVTAVDSDAATGDRITRVELIGSGGTVAASGTFNSNNVLWRDTISRASDYYYARITTADGNKAWTAPVWTIPTRAGSGILISEFHANPAKVDNAVASNITFSAGISDMDGSVSGATLDLSSLGGGSAVAMIATGLTWSCTHSVPANLAPGMRSITLTVQDNSGTQRQKTAQVSVVAEERSLNIYTDAQSIISQSWVDGHGTSFNEVAVGAFEGSKCMDINYTISDYWSGGGFSLAGAPLDMSSYDVLRISYKCSTAPHNPGIGFTFQDGTNTGDDLMQMPGSVSWKTIDVPLSVWIERGYALNNIKELNVNIDGTASGTGHLYIDNVKLVSLGGGASAAWDKSSLLPAHAAGRTSVRISSHGLRTVSICPEYPSTIRIHDVRGLLVARLQTGVENQGVLWAPAVQGVYLATIQSANRLETKQITVR